MHLNAFVFITAISVYWEFDLLSYPKSAGFLFFFVPRMCIKPDSKIAVYVMWKMGQLPKRSQKLYVFQPSGDILFFKTQTADRWVLELGWLSFPYENEKRQNFMLLTGWSQSCFWLWSFPLPHPHLSVEITWWRWRKQPPRWMWHWNTVDQRTRNIQAVVLF